jgi:hypothetical protein
MVDLFKEVRCASLVQLLKVPKARIGTYVPTLDDTYNQAAASGSKKRLPGYVLLPVEEPHHNPGGSTSVSSGYKWVTEGGGAGDLVRDLGGVFAECFACFFDEVNRKLSAPLTRLRSTSELNSVVEYLLTNSEEAPSASSPMPTAAKKNGTQTVEISFVFVS